MAEPEPEPESEQEKKRTEEERQERIRKNKINEANIEKIKDEMKKVVGENFSKFPAFEPVAKAYFSAESKFDFITKTKPKTGRVTLPPYPLKQIEQKLFDSDGNKVVEVLYGGGKKRKNKKKKIK